MRPTIGRIWPWIAMPAALLALIATAAAARTSGVSADREAARTAGTGTSVVNAQKELLRQLLRGLADSQVVRAELGAPPKQFGESRGRVWIFFSIRASNDLDYLRGYWQASVVSGLMRDLSEDRRLPRVAGQSFFKVLPGGLDRYAGGGMIGLERQQVAKTSESELKALVQSGIEAVRPAPTLRKLTLNRLRGHLAPEITVRTKSPLTVASNPAGHLDKLVGELNGWTGAPPRAEGAFVFVYDARGRLVFASGYSVRTGRGLSRIGRTYRNSR